MYMNDQFDSSLALKLLRNADSDKLLAVFRTIPVQEQGSILLESTRRIQQKLITELPVVEIVNLIRFLDPDVSTKLLYHASNAKKKKVIEELSGDLKDKVEFLLKFHPDTAAGMMSLDYIQIDRDASIHNVVEAIRQHEKMTGRFPAILVIRAGRLEGEIQGHTLALHRADEPIATLLKKVPSIQFDADQADVEKIFEKHPHSKIVVLDGNGSILGIIFADDVLRVINKRQQKELYNFTGVREEEDVTNSALSKVHYRYKWLIVNLATAFLAASVVGLFDETISKYVLLAVYMPIVAGMGGNAGTQSMAVTVRGLALRKVDLSNGIRLIGNESWAGAINGLINGLIVAAVAILWNHNPMLGVVLGVAMVVNLIIAGFFGSMIPLIMQKLGKDPATSATIFITTATDVFGFLVFLSLAKALL